MRFTYNKTETGRCAFLLLSELLSGIDAQIFKGKDFDEKNGCVRGITVNSRAAKEGYIFAAIKGYRRDGSDYILDAYERGARIFLFEEGAPTSSDTIYIKVENARKTLAQLSAKLYGDPQKSLTVIGVTGTKGKTTTGYFISRLLSLCGIPTSFVGTLGFVSPNGRLLRPTNNTTPEPTELFSILSECVSLGSSAVVIEASSQALRDFRLHGIKISVAVFTSLGVDHIGECEHKDFFEYVETKRTLFTSYGAKIGVFNADDFYCEYMSKRTEKCIRCGYLKSADYHIKNIDGGFSLNGVEVYPRLPGDFNARNISLAIAVCSELYGIKTERLAPLVSGIAVRGRFEHYSVRGRHIVIDYAHNEMSFREVITLARQLYGGRIITVFGSVGDRCPERRRALCEVSEMLSDYSVITSDDTAYENAEKICLEIYSYFSYKSRAEVVFDRERAIKRAFSVSTYGDTILLLGKGHEEYMRNGEMRVAFSERRVLEFLDKIGIL